MKGFEKAALTLMATIVVAAMYANAASAEMTLLAEWLVNGAALSTSLSVEVSDAILLEDTETVAGAVAVLCEGTFYGADGPNGEGEIKDFSGTECVTEKTCVAGSEASPIEVTPVGLPWKTLLFLMENGEFLELVSATEVGYKVLCLILGLNAEDKCTASDLEIPVVNDVSTGDAEIAAESTASPNTTCTQSGKTTGKEQADELETMLLYEGGLLTVSSE